MDQTIGKVVWKKRQKLTLPSGSASLDQYGMRYAVTNVITVHRQAILLLVVESRTRKLRKVVESRTKFTFDVERVLDSTTVLVLDSTQTLLL